MRGKGHCFSDSMSLSICLALVSGYRIICCLEIFLDYPKELWLVWNNHKGFQLPLLYKVPCPLLPWSCYRKPIFPHIPPNSLHPSSETEASAASSLASRLIAEDVSFLQPGVTEPYFSWLLYGLQRWDQFSITWSKEDRRSTLTENLLQGSILHI